MYKLFRNANGSYIYDARINKLKKISGNLYEFLSKTQSETECLANDEYCALQKESYFCDTDFDFVHPKVRRFVIWSTFPWVKFWTIYQEKNPYIWQRSSKLSIQR